MENLLLKQSWQDIKQYHVVYEDKGIEFDTIEEEDLTNLEGAISTYQAFHYSMGPAKILKIVNGDSVVLLDEGILNTEVATPDEIQILDKKCVIKEASLKFSDRAADPEALLNVGKGGWPFIYDNERHQLYIGEQGADHGALMLRNMPHDLAELYIHYFSYKREDEEWVMNRYCIGRVSDKKSLVAFWCPGEASQESNNLIDCIYSLIEKHLLRRDGKVKFADDPNYYPTNFNLKESSLNFKDYVLRELEEMDHDPAVLEDIQNSKSRQEVYEYLLRYDSGMADELIAKFNANRYIGDVPEGIRGGIESSLKLSSEQENIFICFWLPKTVKERLGHIKGLDDELHMTILYTPNVKLDDKQKKKIVDNVSKLAKEYPKIKCKFTGVGVMGNDDKTEVALINFIDGPVIYSQLSNIVESVNGKWDKKYGFVPHVTIRTEGNGETDLKNVIPFAWTAKHISVKFSDTEQYLIELGTGEIEASMEKKAWDMGPTLEDFEPYCYSVTIPTLDGNWDTDGVSVREIRKAFPGFLKGNFQTWDAKYDKVILWEDIEKYFQKKESSLKFGWALESTGYLDTYDEMASFVNSMEINKTYPFPDFYYKTITVELDDDGYSWSLTKNYDIAESGGYVYPSNGNIVTVWKRESSAKKSLIKEMEWLFTGENGEYNTKYKRFVRNGSSLKFSAPESYTSGSDYDEDKSSYEGRAEFFHGEDHLTINNDRDWLPGETDYHDFPSPNNDNVIRHLDNKYKSVNTADASLKFGNPFEDMTNAEIKDDDAEFIFQQIGLRIGDKVFYIGTREEVLETAKEVYSAMPREFLLENINEIVDMVITRFGNIEDITQDDEEGTKFTLCVNYPDGIFWLDSYKNFRKIITS
jgi:2'-5' RNA ligase